jgi:hypothetical protein
MTKYILIGGYPWKATDGGKAFVEELIKGFDGPVRILECIFARPRQEWAKAYSDDQKSFSTHLPGKQLEFQLADPERFTQQVKWADAIYIRGGSAEIAATEMLKKDGGWMNGLYGKTLAGTSAGADLISKYYYDLDNLKIVEGLGLLPIKVLVHYRSDYNAPNIDWDSAYELLKNHGEELPIVTLAEGQYHVQQSQI